VLAATNASDFLIAESAAMRAIAGQVEAYADGDAPVLITGEHGTGRELVARVLHQRGPRRHNRFVAVRPTFESSDVVPPIPRESRDACERADRALSAATGGTLLIKDITDLSALSQRTLRRAVRDRGSAKTGSHDVHVVATADVDLDLAVSANIVSQEFYDVFGKRRIDVLLKKVGTETPAQAGIPQAKGDLLVCEVYTKRVAGEFYDAPEEAESKREAPMKLWLARLDDTPFRYPVRLEAKTGFGTIRGKMLFFRERPLTDQEKATGR